MTTQKETTQKELTINEFKHFKVKLENKITQAISDILYDFEKETKLTPHYVSINMTDVTNIGDKFKSYIVTGTDTSFDFGEF